MKQRIGVVGEDRQDIERLLLKHGFALDRKNPDIIISYGGDGTALRAEHDYPGIPRLLMRNSSICNLCRHHDFHRALEDLAKGNYTIREEMKLEARILIKNAKRKGKPERRQARQKTITLHALNDINLHYSPPTALRIKVSVNSKKLMANKAGHDEHSHLVKDIFIGDGIVAATPHGSTGYFNSITRKTFTKGFAVAFNNPRKPAKPLFLDAKKIVRIEIVRGPGMLFADNKKDRIILDEGDVVLIKPSKQVARTIVPGSRSRKQE